MDEKGIKCEMESIIDEKIIQNKKMFRVRWHNFSQEDDTWEYEENIKNKEILQKYLKKREAMNEKSKKAKDVSPVTKLKQKNPIQVVSIMKFKDKIYYRVLFGDQTFDSVPSDLLKKVSPDIISKFLISQFQLNQITNKSKNKIVF